MKINRIEQTISAGKGSPLYERERTRVDTWFAWYPVRLGSLSTGKWVWLRWVDRITCCGVSIYQEIERSSKAD